MLNNKSRTCLRPLEKGRAYYMKLYSKIRINDSIRLDSSTNLLPMANLELN